MGQHPPHGAAISRTLDGRHNGAAVPGSSARIQDFHQGLRVKMHSIVEIGSLGAYLARKRRGWRSVNGFGFRLRFHGRRTCFTPPKGPSGLGKLNGGRSMYLLTWKPKRNEGQNVWSMWRKARQLWDVRKADAAHQSHHCQDLSADKPHWQKWQRRRTPWAQCPDMTERPARPMAPHPPAGVLANTFLAWPDHTVQCLCPLRNSHPSTEFLFFGD